VGNQEGTRNAAGAGSELIDSALTRIVAALVSLLAGNAAYGGSRPLDGLTVCGWESVALILALIDAIIVL
jgi:hypothetical protein